MNITLYFCCPKWDSDQFGQATVEVADDASLEDVFQAQGNNPSGSKLDASWWSLSVGDVIESEHGRWMVVPIGFVRMTDEQFEAWKAEPDHRERRYMTERGTWIGDAGDTPIAGKGPLPNGLFVLWMDERTHDIVRVRDGRLVDPSDEDVAHARAVLRDEITPAETIDQIPTVNRQVADAICQAMDLSAELVAVVRVVVTEEDIQQDLEAILDDPATEEIGRRVMQFMKKGNQ